MWCFKRKKPFPGNSSPVVGDGQGSDLPNYHNPHADNLRKLWDTQELGLLRGQKKNHIAWYLKKAKEGKDQYQLTSSKIKNILGKDIPWQVIASLHGLEASFNFKKQLLNGQPWKKRTTWVPKGYGPWQSWSDSCITAFKIKRTPRVWTIPDTLWFMEQFNGTGYRDHHPEVGGTPYLWSYTNHYEGGKYVSDGKFKRSAISLQVGGAVMLKALSTFR